MHGNPLLPYSNVPLRLRKVSTVVVVHDCDYERHFFVISRPEDVAFLTDGTLLICSHYTDVVLKFNCSSGAWTWPKSSVGHPLMWCILGNRNNGRFQLEKMHVLSFHFHENFLGFVIGGSVTKRGRGRWLKSPKLDIFLRISEHAWTLFLYCRRKTWCIC